MASKASVTSKAHLGPLSLTTYNASVQWSKGTHKNPLTQQEIEDKFERLVSRVLGVARTKKIVTLVRNSENESNVKRLTALLAP